MYANNFYLSEIYKNNYQNDNEPIYTGATGLVSGSNVNSNMMEFSYPQNRSNLYFGNDPSILKSNEALGPAGLGLGLSASNQHLPLNGQPIGQPLSSWSRIKDP